MELELIKLAKYYKENPDKEEEVFEKLAWINPIRAAHMGIKTLMKSRLRDVPKKFMRNLRLMNKQKDRIAGATHVPGPSKGLVKKPTKGISDAPVTPGTEPRGLGYAVGKSTLGRAASGYGKAFKKDPLNTGMTTLMTYGMGRDVMASDKSSDPFSFIEARNDLAGHMTLYKEAQIEKDKAFHKEAALKALMTMGQ